MEAGARCALSLLLPLLCACSFSNKVSWRSPVFGRVCFATGDRSVVSQAGGHGPTVPGLTEATGSGRLDRRTALGVAEAAYRLADQYDRESLQECVDLYYRSVAYSWHVVAAPGPGVPTDEVDRRAWELYHSSLAKLIVTGQHFGRLCPRSGLEVNTPAGPTHVAISRNGFPFRPDDFGHLMLVGDYLAGRLTHIHRRPGLGVPLLAIRFASVEPTDDEASLMGRHLPFAATAVLRPAIDAFHLADAPTDAGPSVPTLELFDPLRVDYVDVAGCQVPLAGDISAPLAIGLVNSPWQPFQAFLKPDTSERATLRMLERYQCGKIPVVFVHGLVSDPLTYVDLANELRGRPELNDRYQIWAFEYPTGREFLDSALKLRKHLVDAVGRFRRRGADPALDRIVIVGHSMGGLLAKLQVTESGTILWDHVANRPFQDVVMDDETRSILKQLAFFQPLPFIERAVFVATPHHGSPWATGPVGWTASSLVRFSPQQNERHDNLIRANPGVFAPDIEGRMPTSVGMLRRDNSILAGVRRLPFGRRVTVHSIIGTAHPMLVAGPADGVVPVCSARQPGAASETYIPATHTTILRHPETWREVERILYTHLAAARPSRFESFGADAVTVPDAGPPTGEPTPASPPEDAGSDSSAVFQEEGLTTGVWRARRR